MNNLPPGYVYLKDALNTAVFTKLTNDSEIDTWVAEYMQLSKTTWSIVHTIRSDPAKARKVLFRRIYRCHLNTRLTFKSEYSLQRKHASKNINCPAELQIYIKCPPKKYRSKDDKSATDWPCVITFKHNHNHTINNADYLTKRPIGSDTIEEIMQYFNKGHSAASAYHSFTLKKIQELGDRYDSMVMDRHYFPTPNDFGNLWKKHQKNKGLTKNGAGTTGDDIFSTLAENLKKSVDVLHKFEMGIENNRYVLSFCTPVMQRAVRLLNPSSGIMFVDAITNGDFQSNHKLHLISTQSSAGRIPIGCIISNAYSLKRKESQKKDTPQKEKVFAIGVKNLIDLMPEVSPRIIVVDDDSVERNVLSQYWPNSKILLCSFRVLKCVWKWLTLPSHNIPVEERQMLYVLFRNILMSTCEEEVVENIKIFRSCNQYTQYKNYIEKKLKHIEQWCLCYRELVTKDTSTTSNYIEIMFSLFRDILLEHYITYNLPQLVDFITTDFENYYMQRIIDLVLGQVNKSTLTRIRPDVKDVMVQQICDLGKMQFSVCDSVENRVAYFVDLMSNICECKKGQFGRICKHQVAIIKHSNMDDEYNTLSAEHKNTLYEIATGGKQIEELLLPLKPTSCLNIKHEVVDIDPSNSDVSDDENDPLNDYMSDDTAAHVKNERQKTAMERWKSFISMFGATVTDAIERDPERFIPAVNACIDSYHQNVTSASTLMSSLNNAFKHVPSKEVCRTPKKISSQSSRFAKRVVPQEHVKELPLPPLIYNKT